MRAPFVAAGMVICAGLLGAQQTKSTIDASAIGLRYGDTVSSGGLTIAPSFSYLAGRTSFGASGTLSKFGSGFSTQGAVELSSFTPSRGNLSLELGGSAGGSGHEDGSSTGQSRAGARIHYMKSSGGAWGGGALGGMWDGVSWHRVRAMDAGIWRVVGGIQAVASLTPTTVDDTIRYTDEQVTFGWKVRGTEVAVSTGLRAGSRLPSTPGQASTWGGISISAPFSPRAAVVAAAGSYPLDFTQGFPAGKYASIGVRFDLGTPAAAIAPPPSPTGIARFEVRRVSPTEIRINVRAPSSRTIEIMGDLTAWDPVALRLESAGNFTVTLPVTAGTSQINIRVDGGAWAVPPGLTVVRDETGTEVGILVIPDR